jgi:dCTP deaminase
MIFSDNTIIERLKNRITPFVEEQVRSKNGEKLISYGLSGSGYDVRLSRELKRQKHFFPFEEIDPKSSDNAWMDVKAINSHFVLQPGDCILGVTMEHVDMPEDVMALCIGKSTYARCGLLVNATPIEAGWRGHITLELSNTGAVPIVIYVEEGIAQLVFMQIDKRPSVTYSDRNGKYQDQHNSPIASIV